MPAINLLRPTVTAAQILSGGATAGHVLAADGSGGTEWVAPGGGAALQHNLDGAITGAPGSLDDETEGWSVGSLWWQDSTAQVWVCRDATEGAAVWADLVTSTYGTAAYAFAGHGHEGMMTVGGDPYQVPVSDGMGGYSWQLFAPYSHTHGTSDITGLGSMAFAETADYSGSNHTHTPDQLYVAGATDGYTLIVSSGVLVVAPITGSGSTTVTLGSGSIDVSS